jgi:hypothetical protein
MTTENSKHIGDQPLPPSKEYKGKKLSLYNCPKCDSTVSVLHDSQEKKMQKAEKLTGEWFTKDPEKKDPSTLNYAQMNKIKQTPSPSPAINYSSPDMKRDPKKDPNWKQGADKAKMDQHTKNNPNIIKGINDQHYVLNKPLEKAILPESPYNNEIESKIARIKDKYAEKGPVSMEDKVSKLKDRYGKIPMPMIEATIPAPEENINQDKLDLLKLKKRRLATKGA